MQSILSRSRYVSERELGWWLVFAIALAVTRVDHLGGPLSLPDAAFAVFLLAGLWLRRAGVYVSLAALAFGLDLWATQVAGVDDYCFTPAYALLLLTYAGLFYLPRHMAALRHVVTTVGSVELPSAATLFAALLQAVLCWIVAFAVSNLSFFFFSGHFSELTLRDYVLATWHYVVPYVLYALLYSVSALMARCVPATMRRLGLRRSVS